MKKIQWVLAFVAVLGMPLTALCAEFEFHGDMNNRFLLYSNRTDWLNPEQEGVINDRTVDDTFGELKYRFWVEAASNDGDVNGVYAIEIGGIRFGEEGSGKGQGGSFSGDGANVESRWAYLDMQLPGVESKARFRMGLQPISVNSFFWKETAAGVLYNGQPLDAFGYQLGWIRTIDRIDRDVFPSVIDNDNWLARFNFMPGESTKIGVFGLYQRADTQEDAGPANVTTRGYLLKGFADQADFKIYNIGVDGGSELGNLFFVWDLIYQTGDLDNFRLNDSEFSGVDRTANYDLKAYLAHLDVGYKFGRLKLTGTGWYASGDDNPNDNDLDGFLAVDLDRADNISIFEGLYTDDDTYFTELPYMLDKGFIMLKLALDFQATEKLKIGGAGMYMKTAEDISYSDATNILQFKNDEIGWELNAYVSYMIYKNVEVAVNAGYLFAGDALDAFEVDAIRDGSSDENIFGSSMRVRYKF